AGFRIQIRHLIISLIRPGRIVIAETIIDGDLTSGFPFVLEEEGRHPDARVRYMEIGQLCALRISEQKVRPWNSITRLSRELAVKAPAPAQSGNIEIDVAHWKA